MSKHTSGPWIVKTDQYVDGPIHLIRSANDGIASVRNEADARLISLAPEMLAKLKKVAEWIDSLAQHAELLAKDTRFITLAEANAWDAKNYRATFSDIQALIAKAEAEG